MSFYLVLVGPLDSPLSQHTFTTGRPSSAGGPAGGAVSSSSPAAYAGQLASSFPSWASGAPQAANGSGTTVGANVASMAGVRRPSAAGAGAGGYDEGHLRQMAAHSSLDMIEDAMVGGNMLVPASLLFCLRVRGEVVLTSVCVARSRSRYLKAVDRFNEWTISAFVAPYGQPPGPVPPCRARRLPT